MPQTHLTDIRFDSFDLHPAILAGLSDAGFSRCTPIQAETIPIGLAGKDMAGQAQTGTGKTAAFLVVALQRLLSAAAVDAVSPRPPDGENASAAAPDADTASASHSPRRRHPRVVILAPTRELAVQIHKDAAVLAAHTDFRLGLVYGGTGYQRQRDEVAAGVDILIGTPGRLIDYFKQRVFDLRHVEVVVLDEADRMFDLGFIKDIRFVLRRMPAPTKRLGMLFSATLSYRVMELAYEHMNDPKMIEIAPEQVTADRVTQSGFMVANEEKVPLLIGLLRHLEGARSMVFVNTKRELERVWGFLEGNGLKAAMLSGDVPQKKRLKLLKQFQDGELETMIATDVAARGLHIPGVTHVINYDLPDDAEDYVHRIGRTARAGEAGDAISFVCESYAMCLPDIESFIGARIPIATADAELLADVDPRSRVRLERRPRDGRGERGRRDNYRSGRASGHGAKSGGSHRHAAGESAPGSRPKGGASDASAAGADHPNGSGPGQAGARRSHDGAADGAKRRRRRRSAGSGRTPEPAPQT